MSENLGRVGAGLLLLIAVWILVYWWYEPSASPPRVSAAEPQPSAVISEPAPESQPQAPVVAEPAPVEPSDPEPATLAPRFAEYRIRNGDTAESISRRYFGTAAHAGAIARANPLMDIATLEPGRLIKIPLEPGNIQGVPVRVIHEAPPDSSQEESEVVKRGDKSEDPTQGLTEYTVRPGDSLAKISRRLFGSERHVDAIFEANRDRLTAKEDLQPGQVLRIPKNPG